MSPKKTGREPGAKRAKRQARAATRPAAGDPQARDTYFDQLGEYAALAGVETECGVFVVATHDQHIGRHLFVKRSRPEFRVLRRAVAVLEILAGDEAVANQVFIDVGANIGTATVCALVSHGFGSAVACEPEPENYRLLKTNLAANGLDAKVSCVRAAVSDRLGRADLVVPRESGGFSWIALDRDRIEEIERNRPRRAELPEGEELAIDVTEVDVVTLDRLTETGVVDPGDAGMLWIDAEGHEGHILEGATALTGRGVPIVFEFEPAGLDERGDRGKVQGIAEVSYTHFVDVRRPERDKSRSRFELRPVSELGHHAERFLDPSNPGDHTDLLLLRLEPDQAKRGATLPDLMGARRRERDETASEAD
jgi:FkbM family methyltransferase